MDIEEATTLDLITQLAMRHDGLIVVTRRVDNNGNVEVVPYTEGEPSVLIGLATIGHRAAIRRMQREQHREYEL